MLTKVTNSLYENILCLAFWNGFTINKNVYTPLSENKEKRGLKLFGLVSRLREVILGWRRHYMDGYSRFSKFCRFKDDITWMGGRGLMVNGWQLCTRLNILEFINWKYLFKNVFDPKNGSFSKKTCFFKSFGKFVRSVKNRYLFSSFQFFWFVCKKR